MYYKVTIPSDVAISSLETWLVSSKDLLPFLEKRHKQTIVQMNRHCGTSFVLTDLSV